VRTNKWRNLDGDSCKESERLLQASRADGISLVTAFMTSRKQQEPYLLHARKQPVYLPQGWNKTASGTYKNTRTLRLSWTRDLGKKLFSQSVTFESFVNTLAFFPFTNKELPENILSSITTEHRSVNSPRYSAKYAVTWVRLPTTAGRVRDQVRSCGIYGGQSSAEAGFTFPLPLIPPTCSTLITIHQLGLVQ
jgi:hypothetical protein